MEGEAAAKFVDRLMGRLDSPRRLIKPPLAGKAFCLPCAPQARWPYLGNEAPPLNETITVLVLDGAAYEEHGVRRQGRHNASPLPRPVYTFLSQFEPSHA